jgi:hypothetical protein
VNVPDIPGAARLVPSRAIIEIVHEGTTVLVDVATGRRYTLDDVGRRVWAALAEQPTHAQLRTHLQRGAPLDADLDALLARWLGEGLLSAR